MQIYYRKTNLKRDSNSRHLPAGFGFGPGALRESGRGSRPRQLSRFSESARLLTPHAAPTRLPCREKEKEEVTTALRAAIAAGGQVCKMMICLTPLATPPLNTEAEGLTLNPIYIYIYIYICIYICIYIYI